jgi:hypothetical protein
MKSKLEFTLNFIHFKHPTATVENNMIRGLDIEISEHFGDIISPVLSLKGWRLLHGHDNTHNVGFIIRALCQLFDRCPKDGGSVLELLRDVPCRIVRLNDEVIAIGNFVDDRFIFIDDLMKTWQD